MGLTRNQWLFAGFFLLYSVTFHRLLSKTIAAHEYERIWMLAVGYGVITFVTALILGAFDSVRRSRGVLSFQYHLITFVVSNAVWLVGSFSGLAPKEEMSGTYILGMGMWGLGLLAHYGASRATVKGIPKSQMFD